MMSELVVLAAAAALTFTFPTRAGAHCDTVDGPVVQDARRALAAKDVTPVLKWVSRESEGEIREAFRQALAVRGLGAEARALADRSFFETLVRVHRAGEGAPYTGLAPEGSEVDPAILASDGALEVGSVDALVKLIAADVEGGLRQRFANASGAKAHAGHSVEAGRAFVAAYVEFMHYAERLRRDATTNAAGAEHSKPEGHAH
jgi:hypothetical protein